jgi:hypothetical protein
MYVDVTLRKKPVGLFPNAPSENGVSHPTAIMGVDEVAKNNNITIVIQGLLNKPRFEKSLDHYKEISGGNVILSTWECHRDFVDLAWDIKVVYSKPPLYRFYNIANINCQAITIMNGCKAVKTPFMIKVRTDEYRTDMYKFLGKMFANPDKMITDNVFFRPTAFRAFHCGDHCMGARTKSLYKTFLGVNKICRRFHQYNSKDALPAHLLGLKETRNCDGGYPEVIITVSYLKYKKEPLIQENASEIMRKHFDVVDVRDMGEFIINCNNCLPEDNGITTDRFREWGDHRGILTEFGSIRSMDEMDMKALY